ncbi:hypothetical protein Tco_0999736, partial [Tanacetum coccineum]
TELHKEVQQAAGGPTSLGVTSEERDHPQLSSGPDKGSKNYTPDHTFAGTNPSVLVDKTKSAGDGSQTADTVSGSKVDTRSAFMDDGDESFITSEESSEEHTKRNKDTHAEPKITSIPPTSPTPVQIQELQAQIRLLKSQNQKLEQDKEKATAKIDTLKAQSVFPNINQLTEHLVSSMKPKFSKFLSSYNFSSSISTELKELPTKINALSREVNGLKKHIKEFKVELPKVFNEILQKLETFSSTVSSLTTQVAELKKHKWELPKEFLNLPGQISLVQSHIQTLESLPCLLNKVTDTLNRFASILNAHNKGVPSIGKSTTSPTEGEKNTNPVTEDAKLANLVDLIGIDVVEEYHKKKLRYNKYCDKMLKRKKSPKITNCEVLINKGPITQKIHREDRSEEVISNLKVSDLHLAK